MKILGRITLIIASALIGVLASTAASGNTTRGISVALKASEKDDAPVVETVDLYTESYALVIGIDDYTNGWPKLSNAVKDAELVAATLKDMGFQISFHKDLTAAELDEVFKQFFIIKGDNPDARLFVWYAGHGATLDGEGYLVPADAPVLQQKAAFKFAAVNMRRFGTFMHQARAKHVYSVFDSCFAGTVFASQRALPPSAVTRATTLPVRQFLTSGDESQTVSDDGTFRQLFIRAVNGEEMADANGDGYLTASELGLYLGDRVTNLTQSLQTPRFGKLRDKDFDRGDFVFLLPEGKRGKVPQKSTPDLDTSAQIAFWDSIKNSDNEAVFDAYLQQYPEGIFALLARLKKSEIAAGKGGAAETTASPATLALVPNPTPVAQPPEERETQTPTPTPAVTPVAIQAPEVPQAVQVVPTAPRPEPAKPRPATRTLIENANLPATVAQRMLKVLVLAEEGNANAQFSLGYLFDRGDVVNKWEAAKWYQRAAEQGNTRAQINLAAIYEAGNSDVPQDWNEAVRWYRKAADAGDADAQEKLGYLFEHGLGLQRDIFAAAGMYLRAAEQGRVTAQNNLGRLYQLGTGVTQDQERAIYWYERAVAQGSEVARANLDKLRSPGP